MKEEGRALFKFLIAGRANSIVSTLNLKSVLLVASLTAMECNFEDVRKKGEILHIRKPHVQSWRWREIIMGTCT